MSSEDEGMIQDIRVAGSRRGALVLSVALVAGCGEMEGWQPDEGGPAGDQTVEAQGALTTPSDPLFAQQWHLNNTGQIVPVGDDAGTLIPGTPGVDINIRGLWDFTQGSKQILVAVAETQDIFVTHEDLRDSIFVNKDEVAGDGIDNDGNGCVDDVRGCDFRNGDGLTAPFAEHGTHVSGIIAAGIGNGKGVVGVAPKIKILPITAGYFFPPSLVQAIHYAERMGAKIFHMSQGGFSIFDTDVQAAITASPMLFVFSAGNDGSFRYSYPAAFEQANIISVANVDPRGELAPFSNFGPSVDVGAPGIGILSTIPSGEPESQVSDYGTISGTSMAAPQVTGVAALIMAKLNITGAQAKDRILRSSMRLTSLDGNVIAGGMLDALAAFTDVAPFTVTATSTSSSITLRWPSQGAGVRYDVERDGVIQSVGTNLFFTQNGLNTDSPHFYRVRAVVNGSARPWSHRWMKRAAVPATRVGTVGSTNFVLQSQHPYANIAQELPFVLGARNAVRLRAHFARIELDGNRADFRETGDFLRYQPVVGDETIQLHGTYPPLWTDWQPGVFKFSLGTDADGRVAYGFAIDAYEFFVAIPAKPAIAPQPFDVTNSSVTLNLNFCPGSTRIDLYRSTSATTGFVRIRMLNRDLVTFSDSVETTDTGLASRRTFFYKQTCVNDLGTSPFSDTVQATTL
jgi:subtilase family protein